MSERFKTDVLDKKLRERGLLWEDLGLPASTVTRLRAGRPVRPNTARKVIAKLRSTPVAPDLAELIA